MTDLAVAVRIAAEEEVSAASTRAVQGLTSVEQAGTRTTGVLSALGSGLAMGGGFALAQAGFTGISSALGGLIGPAASFQSEMSAISAVSAGAGGRMGELSALALQLGKDTSFSAQEAAQGVDELVKAGVSIETIIGGGASAALSLAAAGAIGVGEAAEIASNAVNAFSTEANAFAGGPGAFLGRTVDLIAGAANASAIDVNEFKFSLSAFGAVAATVGLSLEDTTTAIAALGNAGIKGSDAGTSLKTMFMNLQPTTKAQTAAFRELGLFTVDNERAISALTGSLQINAQGQKALAQLQKEGKTSVYDLYEAVQKLQPEMKGVSFEQWAQKAGLATNAFFDASGKVKSLADISGVLNVAMKDLTEQQRLQALETMFGTDAIRAAAVMAKMGADGMNSLNAEINKTTAADVARTRLDNLKGSIEQFSGSGETLAIMIGGLLTPALRSLVDFGTSGLNALITGVENLPSMGDAIVGMFQGEDIAIEAVETFSNLLGRDLSAGVMSAIRMAGDAWRTIGQVFEGGWEPSTAIDPIVNVIGQIAVVARDVVIPAITSMADTLSGLLAAAAAQVGPAIAGIGAAISTVTAAIQTSYPLQIALVAVTGSIGANMAVAAASSLAYAAASGVATVAMGAFRVAMLAVNLVMAANPIGILITVLGGLVAAFIYAYNTSDDFRANVDATWAAITVAFQTGVAIATEVLGTLITFWNALPTSWEQVWALIDTATQAGVDATRSLLDAGWQIILAGVDTLWQAMVGAMQAGWALVTGAFQAGLDAASQVFHTILDALFTQQTQAKFAVFVGVLTELWGAVTQLFTVQLTAISEAVLLGWTTIQTYTSTTWTAISTFFTTWWTTTTEFFNTQLLALAAYFTPIWTQIQTEITTIWTAISEYFTTTWTAIGTTVDTGLNTVWTFVTTKGAEIVTGVTTWLGEISSGFTNQISVWGQAGSDMATGLMDSIKSIINSAAQGIIDSLTDLAKRALDAVRGAMPGGGRGASPGGGKADQYLGLVNKVAAEEGVPASSLAALINVENSGERSVSPAGARGIMQVVPGQGFDLPGEDATDPETSIRQGARTLRSKYQAVGSWEEAGAAYFGYGTDAGGMNTNEYRRRYLEEKQRYEQQVINGIGQRGPAANVDLTMDQVAWGTQVMGLSLDEAKAICGPYAAFEFAAAVGRPPNRNEAIQLARKAGWGTWGMGGTGAFMNLLGSYGVNAVRDPTPTAAEAAAALQAGQPVAFSTQNHYFAAKGYDPSTGLFNVGATGTTVGGSSQMSFEQMSQIGGGMQDLIILAGQMGSALTTAGTTGGQAFNTLLLSSQQLADGSTVAITQMGSDVTATITDTSGNVVAQFGQMGTGMTTAAQTAAVGVTEATAGMTATALTSVTDLGTGMMTITQDAAGNTIATVTGMNGQVTAQYATMANGVNLTMGDMSAGVLTTVTDLGTGTMTTVQDMSGNIITTITDLQGNVTSQYTSMASSAVATTGDMATQTTDQIATMAADSLTSVTDLGDGTMTVVQDMQGNVTATITDLNGNVVSQYTTMASDSTTAAEAMSTDTIAAVDSMSTESAAAAQQFAEDLGKSFQDVSSAAEEAQSPVGDFYSAIEEVPSPDYGSIIDELHNVEEAANDAKNALDEVDSGGDGDHGGDDEERAIGGPVVAGRDYLIGERGPEVVRFPSSGYVIPHSRAFGDGSGGSGVVQSIEHHYHLEQNNTAQADVNQIDERTRRTFRMMAAGWRFR